MIKQKILNAMAVHPKLMTIATGFTLAMVIGALLGIADLQPHLAFAEPPDPCFKP